LLRWETYNKHMLENNLDIFLSHSETDSVSDSCTQSWKNSHSRMCDIVHTRHDWLWNRFGKRDRKEANKRNNFYAATNIS